MLKLLVWIENKKVASEKIWNFILLRACLIWTSSVVRVEIESGSSILDQVVLLRSWLSCIVQFLDHIVSHCLVSWLGCITQFIDNWFIDWVVLLSLLTKLSHLSVSWLSCVAQFLDHVMPPSFLDHVTWFLDRFLSLHSWPNQATQTKLFFIIWFNLGSNLIGNFFIISDLCCLCCKIKNIHESISSPFATDMD